MMHFSIKLLIESDDTQLELTDTPTQPGLFTAAFYTIGSRAEQAVFYIISASALLAQVQKLKDKKANQPKVAVNSVGEELWLTNLPKRMGDAVDSTKVSLFVIHSMPLLEVEIGTDELITFLTNYCRLVKRSNDVN